MFLQLNKVEIYQAMRISFNPQYRVNVLATNHMDHCNPFIYWLSIPNIGSMFLQPQKAFIGEGDFVPFQSPISGQCSCNTSVVLLVRTTVKLSIPNIGSMFLQQKSFDCLVNVVLPFNPQYRVNVLATRTI